MLNLNLKPEPYWIDLPRGVRVQVMPAGTTLVDQVTEDLREQDESEEGGVSRKSMVPFAKALARAGIVAWEGIGDEKGNAIEPSPDYIDAMLEDRSIYQDLWDKYVFPALVAAEEGNG